MRMLLLSSLNQTGNTQEPSQLLASFPPEDLLLPNTGSYDMVIGTRGEAFVLGGDFKAASKAWEIGTAATTNERQRLAAKSMIRFLAGDVTAAQADAEKARELLETRVREQPNDFRSLRALSWVDLALNRKADAINIARHTARSSSTRERRGAWFREPGRLGRNSGADRCCHRSSAESEKTSLHPGRRNHLDRAP